MSGHMKKVFQMVMLKPKRNKGLHGLVAYYPFNGNANAAV